MRFLESTVCYVKWLLIFLIGVPISMIGIPLALFSNRHSLSLLQIWCRICLKIFGVRVLVQDHKNGVYANSRQLFVSLNQTSLIELIAGCVVIPTKPLMVINIEFALLPTIGWFIWSCGSVVLIRQWKQQAKRALDRAVFTLRDSRNFWISIEGKRNRHGELGEYRKGPVVMAIKAGAAIVPVVFKGTEKVSPTGLLLVRLGTIEVELCESIVTKDKSLDERDEIIVWLRSLANERLGH